MKGQGAAFGVRLAKLQCRVREEKDGEASRDVVQNVQNSRNAFGDVV